VADKSKQPSSNCVENLESRILCRAPRPAKIATAFLDNRGQAFLTVTVALDTSTLSRKTAALYSAGTDGVFGTSDDARLYTKVGYRKGRLSLRSDALTLDQKYRVVLNSSVIKDVNGLALDGEFNGMPEVSGDGTPGGNYDVVSTPATKTRVRFSTAAGYINIGLYRNTPLAKTNFMHYVQEGSYDSTIIHRSINTGIHIVQGGGFTINPTANTTGTVHTHTEYNNEGTNPYAKGTISLANHGVNTNGSQWYFNTADNTGAWNPGDYTTFGAILDAESQTTLDALVTLPTSGTGAYPLAGQSGNTDVPVRSIAAINARQAFSPKDDLITVDRVAALFDVAATPVAGAARALVSPPTSTTVGGAVTRSVAPTFSVVAVDPKKNSVLDDAAAAA
jgi:cyclophilin family peptidyl-prolyl cis-trans isomerase